MSNWRTHMMKTGVLAAALACTLVLAVPSGAVTGGVAVAPAPSWTAYVVGMHKTSTTVCSGALVGQSWILTAAQCVAGTTQSPCKVLHAYPARDFTIYLGRTSNTIKGTAFKVSAISLNGAASSSVDGQCVFQNDVALLHLTKPAGRAPIWLAPSPAAVASATEPVFYGYGVSDPNNAKSYGALHSTFAGDWSIDTECNLVAAISATCLDNQNPGGSAAAGRDTGGPWTITVDNNPVEAVVHSGYDLAHGFAYGTAVAQPSTGAWLRTKLGIPNVAVGNIVRDPASGDSWLIDPQGYRRPIPDIATLNCLTAGGAQVSDFAAAAIQLMAARVSPVKCGAAVSVLIAGTGDGGWAAPNDNLATLLTNAGYHVTKSATLPADLSGFGQVWWVDTNPPSSAAQDQLVAFEHTGGGVFLTGDGSCCELLNTANTSMINAMVVGGGVTAGGTGNLCTCTSAMPVNSGAVANLTQDPIAVTHVTMSQPGGITGVSGSSVLSYYQPGDITTRQTVAAAWDRPSLVGNGRLVVFMDINWTEPGYRDTNWSAVAQNVAFFLSGLNSPPGPTVP